MKRFILLLLTLSLPLKAVELTIYKQKLSLSSPVFLDDLGEVKSNGDQLTKLIQQPLLFDGKRNWFRASELGETLTNQLGVAIKVNSDSLIILEVCHQVDHDVVLNKVREVLFEKRPDVNLLSLKRVEANKKMCLDNQVTLVRPIIDRNLKQQRIAVELLGDDDVLSTVWYQIRFEQDIAQGNKDIYQGQTIDESDINWIKVDSKLAKKFLSKADFITKQNNTKRFVALANTLEGDSLVLNQFKPYKPVMAGQKVRVTSSHKGVFIQTSGKTLIGGLVGQKVKVLVDGAKSAVTATVVSDGLVEI
ncbi:flagella basal body P-ring formation protein FlgA [Catenovulum sp. SM1970]|uniref:flagella basal body P-ring formation protein FlgA n=1 Tax=Marinifaba aquimaris TaxID=2741323 RepID=UPI001573410A|nr:flagella basal body P-ring formation protein FlgA [Marinifaba aquimaris]